MTHKFMKPKLTTKKWTARQTLLFALDIKKNTNEVKTANTATKATCAPETSHKKLSLRSKTYVSDFDASDKMHFIIWIDTEGKTQKKTFKSLKETIDFIKNLVEMERPFTHSHIEE